MSDSFTWNKVGSHERTVIELFLAKAEERAVGRTIGTAPIPVKPVEALATIAWLRGMLDRRPSTLAD